VGKKSFEEAINELEQIVKQIENGDLSLEESLDFFQKGVELSKYCTKRLDEIEKKISMLIENKEGIIEEKIVEEEIGK